MSLILNKYTCRSLVEGQEIETIWTIIPAVILVFLALPSLRLLYLLDEVGDCGLTVKTIGHQWYWSYEYSDFLNIEFHSSIHSSNRWAKPRRFSAIRCRPPRSFTNPDRCSNSSYICRCNSLLGYSCFGCKSWCHSRANKSIKILCKISWCVLWSVLRNLRSQPFIYTYCFRGYSPWKFYGMGSSCLWIN